MKAPKLSLVTLEYPPQFGGVARYLQGLVEAAEGAIEVIEPKMTQWCGPHWWPMVKLCREEKAKDVMILVSHIFPVGTAAWLSRMMGGPEYIVLFHGLDLRLVRSHWKRWLLRRICSQARLLIVNSESTKRDLMARVADANPLILTPGLADELRPSREHARAQLGIGLEEKVILSIARLVPRKGIDIALQAVANLQDRAKTQYIVLGDGPDWDRLHIIAERLGVKPRWIRAATDEERNQWLSAADVFILPVRDEGTDVEGFGIVFLEAAAAGIPVIAGKSGGASEAVVDGATGCLVDPRNITQMTDALERLLADPILRQRLGETGRQRVQRDFDWKERWSKLKERL